MTETGTGGVTAAPAASRRCLLVANQTLGGRELTEVLSRRIGAGVTAIYVVVPVTPSEHRVAARGEWSLAGSLGTPLPPLEDPDAAGRDQASKRLGTALDWLRQAGAEAQGELGVSDPMVAVSEVMEKNEFDEVIVSTLPQGISRWFRMDLSRRIERRFGVPVTEVIARGEEVS
ncbi:MAG: hypothetical protein ACYDGN_14505 [Acidimicrobiales bacterium]